MAARVVFDTSTVVSVLRDREGSLSWLRTHWLNRECIPLVSDWSVAELRTSLAKKKFRLSAGMIDALLSDYLPFTSPVRVHLKCLLNCRDKKDQPMLDLAISADAELLVSSDWDLRVLNGQLPFDVLSPSQYAEHVRGLLQ